MDEDEMEELSEIVEIATDMASMAISSVAASDIPNGMAVFARKLVNALENEGFTEDQAIAMATPMTANILNPKKGGD